MLLAFAWLLPLCLNPDQAMSLLVEDGIFENISAALFLSSGGLLFILWIKVRRGRNSAGLLVLALLMIFTGGEEISWGQRIFGWSTPLVLDNIQGETTIHNMRWFDKQTASILSMSHMFELFCLCFGFLLPLITRGYSSVEKLPKRWGVPIVPLSLGVFFPINYTLSKLYQLTIEANWITRIAELRECAHAIVWFAVSITLFSAFKRSSIHL